MKAYRRVEMMLHALTVAQGESEWSSLHSSRFSPGDSDPSTHCMEGKVK
jgi:hypothetical protein